jgi:uncharacterized membrane protein YczE
MENAIPILKSIQWKSFPRDFAIAMLGFVIYGLSIALIIEAELGTGPWAVLAVALANIAGTTPGTMIILTGFLVLVGAVLLKEQIGWATLGNILFIGPWTDLFLYLIPSLSEQICLRIIALILAVVLSGVATAVYISVNAGAGPRDSLMLAVSRVSGKSVRFSRAGIEILVVIVGWLLKGPVGIGTLVFAVFIGPLVQIFFKLFHTGPQYSPPEN